MDFKNQRWSIWGGFLFILLININALAIVNDISVKRNKIPKQTSYPITDNQNQIYSSPFWYFARQYDIPIMSFNELDYYILNIIQNLTKITEKNKEYADFANHNSLSVSECLDFQVDKQEGFKCWYKISYKDIHKIVEANYSPHDNVAKEVFNLFMYREKLSFKLLAIMLKFDTNTALNLVKDINDYYGMKNKYSKNVVDYVMRSIFETTYFNHKNTYNKGHKAIKTWISRINLFSSDKITSHQNILNYVNRMFSMVDYVSDQDAWGVDDYHATPFEMLVKGAGDCEDFAYAKMITLLSLGFNLEDMNLKYVIVNNYGRPLAHMVLVVHTDSGSYVLDNLKTHVYLLKHAKFLDSKYEYDLAKLKFYEGDTYRTYAMVGYSDAFTKWRNKFLGLNN